MCSRTISGLPPKPLQASTRGAAAHVLAAPVGAADAHARDRAVRVGVEVGGGGRGHRVDPLARDRVEEAGQQLGAVPVGRAVHAVLAVAGVEEVREDLQRRAVGVREPVHGHGGAPRDGQRHLRVGAVARLLQDLPGEVLRRVRDAGRLLEPGAGGGDLAAGEGGAARRRLVALDHQHVRAALPRRQRRAAPAGPGADHDDGNGGVETPAARSEDAHRRAPLPGPVAVRTAEATTPRQFAQFARSRRGRRRVPRPQTPVRGSPLPLRGGGTGWGWTA